MSRHLTVNSIIECPMCGLNYVLPEDRRVHKAYCKRYLQAQGRYGIIVDRKERENTKREGWNLVWSKEDIPLNDRLKGAVMVFRSWFSRSVEANRFKLNHPSFGCYVAMLLNQPHMKSILPVEVYSGLVKAYGTRPGLPNGKSYWRG